MTFISTLSGRFPYVRDMAISIKMSFFNRILLTVFCSMFATAAFAASGNSLQDTIYSLRFNNGTVAIGRILYKDSIRTTLQAVSGEIKSFSNHELAEVSIYRIRTVTPDPFRLYATPGGSLTNSGGGIGLVLLLQNNWGLEVKYRSLTYRSARKPGNYDPGGHEEEFCYWIFGCWDEYVYETPPDPRDYSEQYSISVHRKYGSVSAQARLGWQAGVTYMETEYYEFQKKDVNGPYGSNYDVTRLHARTPGLQAGVSLDFPLTRYWGLELGLIGQVNREHSMLFLELNSPLGLVRGRRHPPIGRIVY